MHAESVYYMHAKDNFAYQYHKFLILFGVLFTVYVFS